MATQPAAAQPSPQEGSQPQLDVQPVRKIAPIPDKGGDGGGGGDKFVQRAGDVDLGLLDDPMLMGVDAPEGDVVEEPARAPRVRGADGRFASPDAASQDVEPQDGEPDEGEPPPSPEKFKFAGEEWESEEKAAQSFRTLRGQFKGMQRRVSESRAEAERVVAQWKEAYTELQSQYEALRQGAPADEGVPAHSRPANGTATAQQDEVAEIVEGIDWDFVNTLAVNHSPVEAIKWALYKGLQSLRERTSSEVNQTLAPFKTLSEEAQRQNQFASAFQEASQFADDEGNPLYPELHNQETLPVIVRILQRLDLPDEISMSPRGIYLAVAAYRDLVKKIQTGQAQPPTTTQTLRAGAARPAARLDGAAAAASFSEGGSGRGLPSGPMSQREAQKRAADAIMRAGSDHKESLELGVSF